MISGPICSVCGKPYAHHSGLQAMCRKERTLTGIVDLLMKILDEVTTDTKRPLTKTEVKAIRQSVKRIREWQLGMDIQ
jgi:hypothetical protein